jgi:hypothetical protein
MDCFPEFQNRGIVLIISALPINRRISARAAAIIAKMHHDGALLKDFLWLVSAKSMCFSSRFASIGTLFDQKNIFHPIYSTGNQVMAVDSTPGRNIVHRTGVGAGNFDPGTNYLLIQTVL